MAGRPRPARIRRSRPWARSARRRPQTSDRGRRRRERRAERRAAATASAGLECALRRLLNGGASRRGSSCRRRAAALFGDRRLERLQRRRPRATVPAGQVDRVILAKAERRQAAVERHRDQAAVVAARAGFVADPRRPDRALRSSRRRRRRPTPAPARSLRRTPGRRKYAGPTRRCGLRARAPRRAADTRSMSSRA